MRNIEGKRRFSRTRRTIAAVSALAAFASCTIKTEGSYPPHSHPEQNSSSSSQSSSRVEIQYRPAPQQQEYSSSPQTAPATAPQQSRTRQMTAAELQAGCRTIQGSRGTCSPTRFVDYPEGNGTVAHMTTGEAVDLNIPTPGHMVEIWNCSSTRREMTPIRVPDACQVTVRAKN